MFSSYESQGVRDSRVWGIWASWPDGRAWSFLTYDAARDPKTLIWLRTGHLLPTDSVLIRALVDTALSRLPILREAESPE